MNSYRKSHATEGRGIVYDERYASGREGFYWSALERPLLQSLFAELAKSDEGPYLDVACGTGRILGVAAPYFSDVTGVDISDEMLSQARAKFPNVNFLKMDVTTENAGIGPFGVVTLFRFLLNAESVLRDRMLAWIRRTIREDGVFVLNNHLNSASVQGSLLRLRNRQLGYGRHNLLADSEVHQLLTKHGFEIVDSFGVNFLPAIRDKSILPMSLIRPVEHMLMAAPALRWAASNRIYVCRPVGAS